MRREFVVSDFFCIFQLPVLTSKSKGSIWKREKLALIEERSKTSAEAFWVVVCNTHGNVFVHWRRGIPTAFPWTKFVPKTKWI
jgi:hypothetical protein